MSHLNTPLYSCLPSQGKSEVTGVELVIKSIEFAGPERIPIWNEINKGESDVILVGSAPQYWKWEEANGRIEECIDEFGCKRKRVKGDTGIGQPAEPVINDWNDLLSYKIPVINAYEARTKEEVCKNGDAKYVLGDLGLLLWAVFNLRGMTAVFEDLYLHRIELVKLLKKISAFKNDIIDMYARIGGVHGLICFDDWGTQTSLLINPSVWRDVFKPFYREIFHEVKRYNMHVWMHSCGYVHEIIPDLIEIGVQVLNFNQPRLLGIEKLGKDFGGRVSFLCQVDEQVTIPLNDARLIEEEIRLLIDTLGCYKGGFIGYVNQGEGVHPSSAQLSNELFRKWGKLC